MEFIIRVICGGFDQICEMIIGKLPKEDEVINLRLFSGKGYALNGSYIIKEVGFFNEGGKRELRMRISEAGKIQKGLPVYILSSIKS